MVSSEFVLKVGNSGHFIFKTLVSSTNLLIVILSSKSLIYYIKNNKGPNTDTCGTPFESDFSQPYFYSVDYAIPNTMGFLFK